MASTPEQINTMVGLIGGRREIFVGACHMQHHMQFSPRVSYNSLPRSSHASSGIGDGIRNLASSITLTQSEWDAYLVLLEHPRNASTSECAGEVYL